MRKQIIELMILKRAALVSCKLRKIIKAPVEAVKRDYHWCKLRIEHNTYEMWRDRLIAQIRGF